jgi:hypothetical protein
MAAARENGAEIVKRKTGLSSSAADDQAFALHALAGEFARSANCLGFLACAFF